MEKKSGLLQNKLFYELCFGKKYQVIRYAFTLLVIVLIVYSSFPGFRKPYSTYINLSLITTFVLLFYVNIYWLVPRFLLKGKFLLYIFCVLGFITLEYVPLVIVQQKFDQYLLRPQKEPTPALGFGFFAFQMTLIVGASASIKLFQRWLGDTEKIHELETITIRSEMEQLRNQISPHFLFNTLNNVNVLTHKDPRKASDVLIKLSDILRYQLYDCARSHVLLSSEIHFLQDYLNLENIRRDHFEYFIMKEGDMNGIQLPPMLFITFVENAVKHNADPQNASFVHVYFCHKDNKLIFRCINSKPQFKVMNNGSGGLGLANVKRRLNLLYPNTHILHIEEDNKKYSLDLTIHL